VPGTPHGYAGGALSREIVARWLSPLSSVQVTRTRSFGPYGAMTRVRAEAEATALPSMLVISESLLMPASSAGEPEATRLTSAPESENRLSPTPTPRIPRVAPMWMPSPPVPDLIRCATFSAFWIGIAYASPALPPENENRGSSREAATSMPTTRPS